MQTNLFPMRKKTPDYAAQLALVCSSDEAAELLDCTPAWVKVLCQQGRLAAKKFSREWIICRASVLAFAELPPLAPGPKVKS